MSEPETAREAMEGKPARRDVFSIDLKMLSSLEDLTRIVRVTKCFISQFWHNILPVYAILTNVLIGMYCFNLPMFGLVTFEDFNENSRCCCLFGDFIFLLDVTCSSVLTALDLHNLKSAPHNYRVKFPIENCKALDFNCVFVTDITNRS